MLEQYRYKGKHRAPSSHNTAYAVTTVGLVAAMGMGTAQPAFAATSDPDWGAIAWCESRIRNIESDSPTSSASGYFQFIDDTWAAYGGTEFAPRAIDATLAQQRIVADRAYADRGYAPWTASESCWDDKVGTGEYKLPAAVKPSPKPRPKPSPTPRAKTTAEAVHTVKSGDTLSGIAAVRDTSWQHLHEMNPQIGDPNSIYPGDTLDVTGHPAGREVKAVAVTKTEPEPSVEAKPVAEKPVGIAKVLASQKSTGFDGVKSHVAQAGHLVANRFGVDNIGGVADRSRKSDHPKGLALDFMVSGNEGDQIAEFMLSHKDVLNVKYVIWKQRYNDGTGWDQMEDRGSDTANHMDHVHVSFND